MFVFFFPVVVIQQKENSICSFNACVILGKLFSGSICISIIISWSYCEDLISFSVAKNLKAGLQSNLVGLKPGCGPCCLCYLEFPSCLPCLPSLLSPFFLPFLFHANFAQLTHWYVSDSNKYIMKSPVVKCLSLNLVLHLPSSPATPSMHPFITTVLSFLYIFQTYSMKFETIQIGIFPFYLKGGIIYILYCIFLFSLKDFYFFNKFIYLFFGCVRSSLLHLGFLQLR